MRRAARMDVNSGPGFSKPERRSGMVKMNMTEKYMPHVCRFDPELCQCGHDVVKCGFRSGIEKHDTIARFQNGDRDNPGTTQLERINNVKSQEQLPKLKTETGKAEKLNGPALPACRS